MKTNEIRIVRNIDECLIEKLESEFFSFKEARKKAANWQSLTILFSSLTDAFYKAVEARAQAINEAVKKEDFETTSILGEYTIGLTFDKHCEDLLLDVSAEIDDYAKKINL